MAGKLLKVENLKTSFFSLGSTIKAVRGVSFSLDKGEIMGIVGESGSGKSVTCLSIVRLVPRPGKIVCGNIIFKGTNILGKDEEWVRKNIRGKNIAMIFQDSLTALNPAYTVAWQMREVMVLNDNKIKSKKEETEIFIDILRKIKVSDPEDVLYKYPHQLSGGMRQRIIIAIVLLLKPSILIADEPTTSLDVTTQHDVLDIIAKLQETLRMSVILVSHDLNLVAQRCKRLIVMYGGMIVESGESEELINYPKCPYTQALMKCIPPLYGDKSNFSIIPGDVVDPSNLPSGCPFHPRCNRRGPKCDKKIPELLELDKDHYVRCFYPL